MSYMVIYNLIKVTQYLYASAYPCSPNWESIDMSSDFQLTYCILS